VPITANDFYKANTGTCICSTGTWKSMRCLSPNKCTVHLKRIVFKEIRKRKLVEFFFLTQKEP
jgi:hypothetical protein